VTNGIPLGCPLFLPVDTVNSVQTLKDGSSQNFSTFERPHLVFNAEGVPTHTVHGASPVWDQYGDHHPCEVCPARPGTVRALSQRFALEDAIEFHAFAPLEALTCVRVVVFLAGVLFLTG
jgi:hypothetical protein